MARIAQVYIVLGVDDDGEVADFCSETFSGMPYVIDWAHVNSNGSGTGSVEYDVPADYEEGQFLEAVGKP